MHSEAMGGPGRPALSASSGAAGAGRSRMNLIDRRLFLTRLAALGGVSRVGVGPGPRDGCRTATERRTGDGRHRPRGRRPGQGPAGPRRNQGVQGPEDRRSRPPVDRRRLQQRASLLHLLGLRGRRRRQRRLRLQPLRCVPVAPAGYPRRPPGATDGRPEDFGQHGVRRAERPAVLLRRPGAPLGQDRHTRRPRVVPRAGRLQTGPAHLHGRWPLRGLRLLPGDNAEHGDRPHLLHDARTLLSTPALGRHADRHARAGTPWPPGARRRGSATS